MLNKSIFSFRLASAYFFHYLGSIFLIVVFSVGISSCSPLPTLTLTKTPSPLPATQTPIPSVVPSPTITPTSTKTPLPSATPDVSPKYLSQLGKGWIGSIARSLDGKLIAMIEGSKLRWIDANSWKEVGEITIEESTSGCILISPNNQVILIELAFGAQLVYLNPFSTEKCCIGDTGSGTDFVFSRDSRYLAYRVTDYTSGGPYNSVTVYDLETHSNIDTNFDKLLATQIAANSGPVDWNQSYPVLNPQNYHRMSPPAISPGNRWLAAGYQDTSHALLYTWDLSTGNTHLAIPYPAKINSVDFSPDGSFLAAGGDDGVVRVFNPQTGELVRTLTGFTDSIISLRFSKDSHLLEIEVTNQPIQRYDLGTGLAQPIIFSEYVPDPYLHDLHMQGYADGNKVSFSPDGRTLALGGQSIQLWDIRTMSVTASLENPYSYMLGWTFSPDGSNLAGITQNGDILVWNTSSSDLVFSLSTAFLATDEGHLASGISTELLTSQSVAFAPDGDHLAIGIGSSIEIWNIARSIKERSFLQSDPLDYVTAVSYSADGKQLYAILNHIQDAQVWDVQSGQQIKQLDLPTIDSDTSPEVVLAGSHIALVNYAGSDFWIELWDLDTRDILTLPTLGMRTGPPLFSPDGSLIATISEGYLLFWETHNGQLLDSMEWNVNYPGLAISPDNTRLAEGQNAVARLWDISAIGKKTAQQVITSAELPPTTSSNNPTQTPYATQVVIFPVPPNWQEGAISPDNVAKIQLLAHFGYGTLSEFVWLADEQSSNFGLLTAGSQGVYRFSTDPLTETAYLPASAWFHSLALLDNREILAAGVVSQSVQVWNVSTNSLLAKLPGSDPVQIDPTGNLLVYGDNEGDLHVYDLASLQPVSTLHSWFASQLPVFSPGGNLLAAVNGFEYPLGSRNLVRVWDTRSGTIVNSLGGPDADITDLSFSADGRYLVGAAGGSAWVWDTRPGFDPAVISLYSGEVDGNLTLYHQSVTSAALSPDNRILAIGDNQRNVWLYNRTTHGLIYRLYGHSAPLQRLRFSPDGTRLLSIDQDGNFFLWDTNTGKLTTKMAAHTGTIRGLVFDLDGELRAWGTNTAWVISPSDGSLLQSTSIYSGTIFAASPAGDWIAVSNHLRMSVWDASTGALWQVLREEPNLPYVEYYWEGLILPGYYRAEFSPDGKKLMTHAPGETRIYSLQDSNTFTLTEFIAWPYDQVLYEKAEQVTYSLDGSFIAASEQLQSRTVSLVLSNEASHEINRLEFPEGGLISALAFNPNARLLAVGQDDGTISILDVSTLSIIHSFAGHKSKVNSLAFSPNGLYLASAGDDGIIYFWGLK